jgi:methyl-accepting chemotaxis protein
MEEQARAMRDINSAAQIIARDITAMSRANEGHSAAAAGLLSLLSDIRAITDRNVADVAATRQATITLLERARALDAQAAQIQGNGRSSHAG